MTCDERDQEILLLAHGALSLPRRLTVQAHLRRCAACRKRYDRLAQVSSTLSAALCAPARTPWMPTGKWAGARGATFGTRLLAVFSLLLIALTVTVLYLAFSGATPACSNNTTPVSSPPATGCAPSLPNDHCR